MIGPGPSQSLPLSVALRIDRLCDRFEADWSGPRRPRLEDYLADLPAGERPAALRALMELELALRQESGEEPTVQEYRERFPEFAEQVDSAFESTSLAGEAEAPDADGGADRPATSLRFRILRDHARGGLGRVSVALDRELGREVALKEIRLERADDPASRARFLREAEITGRLEHPGIVPIYALGRYRNGRPYYAMRFIQGQSLREAIRALHSPRRPGEAPEAMGLRRLLRAFIDVCNVVAYAHSRGVVHRDLKPANVMLGPFGETLVVDWGLAKALDDGPGEPGDGRGGLGSGSSGSAVETHADSIIGTPAYMSPEQAEGKLDRVGPPSDVYSLGAMLHAILVGRPPAETRASGIASRGARVEVPRLLDPRVPRALEAVCVKAMAERPEGRYDSARSLGEEVERWMADEPVSAMPEPLLVRARRMAKRNKVAAASAAAALVVATVALGVLAVRERASNDRLRLERDRATARYSLAKEAIDGFREAVEENLDVRDRPDLASVRKALLRQPIAYYRRLLEELGSGHRDGLEDLGDLADAYDDLASLSDEMDTPENALRIAQDAVSIRRRLAVERPGVRNEDRLANSLNQLGNVLARLNRADEALEVLGEAVGLRRSLVVQAPEGREQRLDLARLLLNIAGRRSELGRFEESDASYEEALALLGPAEAADPSDPDLLSVRAAAEYGLGNLRRMMAREARTRSERLALMSRALQSFDRGSSLQERAVAEDPENVEALALLGRARNNAGLIRLDINRLDEALDDYESAREAKQRLVGARPTVASYRADLARTEMNIGEILFLTGRLEEADRSYREAMEEQERLVAAHPEVDLYRSDLANTLYYVGRLRNAEGRLDEALAPLRRGADLQREVFEHNPGASGPRRGLSALLFEQSLALRGLGLPREAAKATRDRIALWGSNPGQYYDAACDLAQCLTLLDEHEADYDELADEAVRMLRLGLDCDPDRDRYLPVLARDDMLRPLRGHSEFRDLMLDGLPPGDPARLDLDFPDDPFARLR